MDEEKERELDEYMGKIIGRGLSGNPSLGGREPSPGIRWALRQTARSTMGLPPEPGEPDTPVDPAEIVSWVDELERQSMEDLAEARQLEEYGKRRFNFFH